MDEIFTTSKPKYQVPRKSCFDHMRYVMAILGSMAFALLVLMKDIEFRQPQSKFLRDPQRAQIQTAQLTILGNLCGACLMIPLMALASFGKLSAKWTMAAVISFHYLQLFASTCLNYNEVFRLLAMTSFVTHIMSPSVIAVAMHGMIAQWSPPTERSVLTAFVYAGISAGVSWTYMFRIEAEYVGVFGILWLLLWCFLIGDSPQNPNSNVSQIEQDRIRTSIESYTPCVKEDKSIRMIIFSRPFYSALLVECSLTVIQSQLLTHLNEKTMGTQDTFTMIVKYSAQASFILAYGIVQTLCLEKKFTTFDNSRKFSSIRAIILSLSMIIISNILGGNQLNVLATVLIGGRFCGAIVNIIDISPKHAAFLMAIVQICSQMSALFTYILVVFAHTLFGSHTSIASLVITPIAIFAATSALLYFSWGSTVQLTSTKSDVKAEHMYTYGPLKDIDIERY